jgi:hypothetical protein
VRDFARLPMPVLFISRAAPEGVEAKMTKSGKDRRVPVADRIMPILKECAAGKGADGVLFTTSSGHKLHASPVKRAVAWPTVAPGRRNRDLRHTAACLWLARGVDPGDGEGLARTRVHRNHEHLPAPPRVIRGPGRIGPSERAGVRRGCARGTNRRMTRTEPSRRLSVRAGQTFIRRGAACRNRTDDLLITSETLYRLS